MPVDHQPDSNLDWFKSSYSGGNATECVEAAFIPRGVLIRDSKHPRSPHLRVSAAAWAQFIEDTGSSSGDASAGALVQ
ncbi:DUF397 domain-containing protein [Streptomyces sp. Caat 7-52]|uniref:DUF397 domain-containing protein n=1 Tax=Streptomyces sp. Caat 7-52 TaxID=2949637 RepID=UPI002034BB59|nr:DUF397 domain-containing protein [Streptomyces sp. Caat 7-52]